MNLEYHALAAEIRAKIEELKDGFVPSVPQYTDDDVIPELGILDSPGVIELIVWLEQRFGIEIPDEDATIESVGSIRAIVTFVSARKTA